MHRACVYQWVIAREVNLVDLLACILIATFINFV
jgi:hypothetical protein